ncbi:hypothetical protein MUK42_20150, partial [Musa troglodytarum]
GPEGGTFCCFRDPNRRPPCALHHSSSIGLAAIAGDCRLESSSRNTSACLHATAMNRRQEARLLLL